MGSPIRNAIRLLVLLSLPLAPAHAADGDAAKSALSQGTEAPARPAKPLITEMIIDLGDNITMKLVRIPAGRFLMGSPPNEQGRNADEGVAPADAKGGKTQVEVTISKPFYMGVYEVTVDQYKQFSSKGDKRGTIKTWGPGSPEYHQRGGIPFFNWSFENKEVKSEQNGNHPALATLPEDAQTFCEWLSEKTGKKVMLPTEAQWEYACRASSTTRFSFGDKDEELCRYANYCDQSNTCAFPWQDKAHSDGFDKTSPVGSFKPNAWGLYDTTRSSVYLTWFWWPGSGGHALERRLAQPEAVSLRSVGRARARRM